MERRDFLKVCAAGAAAAGAPALAADARPQLYSRTLLVDEKGAPLRAGRVPVERNLI
jgi:anaerobic selenocysteine-containing dehydrogenase